MFAACLIAVSVPAIGARYAVRSVYEKLGPVEIDGVRAQSAFLRPLDIALDQTGNLYVLTMYPRRVARIGADGVVRVIAGGGAAPPAAGTRATAVDLPNPQGIAVTAAGVLYVSDRTLHTVYRVGADGLLEIVAGTGTAGFSGDGGPAREARLNAPIDLAVDGTGNLFISDTGNMRVRRVTPGGVISTVAGTGSSSVSGDGGPATSAGTGAVGFLSVDSSNRLYLADSGSVRRIDAAGVIQTIAGGGASTAEDSAPRQARFSAIRGFAAGPNGTLYLSVWLALTDTARLRTIPDNGNVTTLAGGSVRGSTGDGGPAAAAGLASPTHIAVSASGAVYFVDHLTVRRIEAGVISTVAGSHAAAVSGEGGPLAAGQLRQMFGVTQDAQGDLYLTDRLTHSVYRVDAAQGMLRRIAGTGYPGYNGESGSGPQVALCDPRNLDVDSAGNLYIDDSCNSRIRRLTPAGALTTIAGTSGSGAQTFREGMQATQFALTCEGLRVGPDGLVYIGAWGNSRVLRVTAGGTLQTVAGSGTTGFSGDGGPATAAQLRDPSGLAFDEAGNLYVADWSDHRIRRIDRSGIISTVAGTGQSGFGGDGGLAASAVLFAPSDVSALPGGGLLVADSRNGRVRRISAAGVIETVGGGGSGFGDQFEATGVEFTAGTSMADVLKIHRNAAGTIWVVTALRLLRLDTAQVFANWVYNCASFVSGPVAPGECFAFYGEDIGPPAMVQASYGTDNQLPRTLSGTQVLVNGAPVPLIFVSETFSAGIMPYGISGTVRFEVQRGTARTNALDLSVSPSMPGLFAYSGGTGQVVAVNIEDGTFNSASSPATRGQWMTAFLTGQGAVVPGVADGVLITGPVWPAPAAPVRLFVGGVEVAPAELWAGLTFQGVLQLNFRVPPTAASGSVAIRVLVGDAATQAGATVHLK